MSEQEIKAFNNEKDLKTFLATNYINQINNFFGDKNKALRFLSSVMADVQRNPKLLTCTPASVINAYMTMAQLGFMPSGVSGESYVLPYNIAGTMTAQFQMGYQGLVTLFYQAGVEKITSDVVRKNDKTSFIDGVLRHEIDLSQSNEERGEIIGVYTRAQFRGEETVRYMNVKDIYAHGKKFSKSYDPNGKFSPWNIQNDPEFHMGRKTVLKQHGKLLPKNENINKAIALDNQDSIIADRLQSATEESKPLKMGNLLKDGETKKEKGSKQAQSEDSAGNAESLEASFERNEAREAKE